MKETLENQMNLKHLLASVKNLIKDQKENEILRGEKFNIFTILKMEHYEEKTHSAFIKELLDPKGSHLMGNVFLKLFITMLENKGITNVQEHLTFPIKKVLVEKSVGNISTENKEGGRIDIYIEGSKGNVIYIENKIYAGDQKAQLVRYFNHKKEKNILLYLTLYGSEPSTNSITKKDKTLLIDGEDFYTLSYKEDIANWLKNCIKEAAEQPILRESIKQYLILVKKLTKTMSNTEQTKLRNLIVENLEASKYIANNYAETIQQIRQQFREDIMVALKAKLLKEYKIEYFIIIGGDIKATNAAVWIKKNETDKIYFGLEPFSGSQKSFSGGSLFIGVCANKNDHKFETYDSSFGDNSFWYKTQLIYLEKEQVLNLEDPVLLKKLSDKESLSFKNTVESVVNQCYDFIKINTIVN